MQGTRVTGSENLVTLNDFFHIGSCGKSGASGHRPASWSTRASWLDERIFDRLPEYRELSDPAYADVTLEDLFLCRGGIAAYTSGEEVLPDISPRSRRPPPRLRPISAIEAARVGAGQGRTIPAPVLQRQLHGRGGEIERTADAPWEEQVGQTLSRDLGFAVHIGWPNTLNAAVPALGPRRRSTRRTSCAPTGPTTLTRCRS